MTKEHAIMDCSLIYMTASDQEEAARIGRHLVEERLAACVNILGQSTSIYRWQGEVATDEEVAFIAKTRTELVGQLSARVSELHSYDCPCIVAVDLKNGSNEFLAWIERETS